MALQFSSAVRNARLDAIETALIASGAPTLRFYTGTAPADTNTAPTGTLLATLTLPADPFAAASGGSKAKSGTWSGTGSAAGNIGYFRLYDAAGTPVCHAQGTVTATGGGGDMTVDNVSIAVSQAVTVNTFSLTDPNG